MIACHVSGLFFLPLMPLLFGAIANNFGANSFQLGTLGTVQLSCSALGAFFLSKLAKTYNGRTLVIVAISIELLLNIASAMTESITSLFILRAMSGLCQGVLLASAAAIAAKNKNTEGIYSLYNSILAVCAVLALFQGASIIEQHGHFGGFLVIVVIDLIALLVIVAHFPDFDIRAKSTLKNLKITQGYGVLLRPMFALALFGAALSGMQTFIERLGDWHGGTTIDIGHALALGWCLAIFSPFLVVPFIKKFGGVKALLGSYLFVAMIALSLSLDLSLSYYLMVAAIFTPAALFIESLQFGILGNLDNTGKLAALGPAAISLGSGVGPFIAGGLVGVFGLQSIGFLACACFVISIFVLFPLAINTYKKNDKKVSS